MLLKIGILGSGFMAGVHARNLVKEPNVELAAICGNNPEDVQALAEAVTGGKAACYQDFHLMLEEMNLDAVYICIPPYAHNGEVEAAARRGIAAFLEKPIALNSEKALQMTDAVEAAGVVSQVGYHNRFGSAVLELKRRMELGEAGIPTLFDGRYDCNSLHSPWWRERSKSGGQVLEQVIHTYDMAMHIFGQPESVAGFAANLCHKDVPGYTVEDTSASIIRFASGSLANICASNNAVPMEWNSSFSMMFSKLTVHFLNPNKAEFIRTDGETPLKELWEQGSDMYCEETRAFLAAVRGEGPQLCPIREGYASLLLVEKMLESAERDGVPIQYT